MAEFAVDTSDLARLVVGTAAIGLPYGLPPVAAGAPALITDAAADLLIRAVESAGIGSFDTAPAYGVAESRLGRALSAHARVWTKVGGTLESGIASESCEASLTRSLAALQRSRIDLLQWHNWSPSLCTATSTFAPHWRALAADSRVSTLGATTYGRDDALAAVTSGLFEVVQVEWNLLNQGVLNHVAEAAEANGVSLAVRSVLLQGVLTDRGRQLPQPLAALREARARAEALAQGWGMCLHSLALRAALDHPAVRWVVIGIDSRDQLEQTLSAATMPPLSAAQRQALAQLDLGAIALTDPRTWSLA